MNPATINFSTGPLNCAAEVRKALAEPAISHRSKELQQLYKSTCSFLSEQLQVRQTLLLTGSGTTANEAMIAQIKAVGGHGLILANGEFGQRLITQSLRASLEFEEYCLLPGQSFQMGEVEARMKLHQVKWLLFCHCETSTGVVNDLDSIVALCARHQSRCYVDCMSTVGTCSLDLSGVSMATASSGKGLGSVPGLAVVLANAEIVNALQAPACIDLGHYTAKDGIPFTISSNLIHALHTSIRQKLHRAYYGLIDHYAAEARQLLKERALLQYDHTGPKVLTVSTDDQVAYFIAALRKNGIIISHESDYLIRQNSCQIAFFGYYHETQLIHLQVALQQVKRSSAKQLSMIVR